MLSVGLTFIYCGIVFFILGVGIRRFVNVKTDSVLFAGLVIATIYSEVFSLIYKVGLAANVILACICCFLCFIFKKELGEGLKQLKKTGKARWIYSLIIFLFWSFFTSRGYIHYDSDLYHAQSIRWIEEYGVVYGLGNLHNRLAYNSSLFAVSALFSMKFICGQSLHVINGFLAFILSINLFDLFSNIKNKRIALSDFARLGLLYYLVNIEVEIISPASDYAIMLTVFFIIIKWLELLERNEASYKPYALLCVLGVYAVSLKLTAAIILLLTIKPVIMMIREKKSKRIITYLGLGFAVILPWLIRNIVLSGYLIYPFPAIDIFNVDWKIPRTVAITDANEIKAWGTSIEYSIYEKLILLGDALSIIILICFAIYGIIKKRLNKDMLLIMTVVSGSFFFWYSNSPLARYGYAYMLLLLTLTLGLIYKRVNGIIKIEKAVLVIICLFILWRLYAVVVNANMYAKTGFWINQKDYGSFKVKSYEINDITFYYPEYGDQIGYDYFPASTSIRDIELRGNELKDGFRNAN